MHRIPFRKAFKNRNCFWSSWQLILKIIRSSSIHEQHYNHVISLRFWRLLQNLLSFLQAGKEKSLHVSQHIEKRLLYGERHSYSLGKDICFCCASKHIVKDILPPVWSKSWEVKSEQSISAVSYHFLVLMYLLPRVQSTLTNVMPSMYSLMLCVRLAQNRVILIWFYQIVSAHGNHK